LETNTDRQPDSGEHQGLTTPRAPGEISVTLNCVFECYDRDAFQRAGHFVPGNCTGPEVYILTLNTPDGLQVLRVMASNIIECRALMRRAIQEYITTSARSTAAEAYTYEQFQALVKERGQFAQFIEGTFKWERDHGQLDRFPSPYAVAVHYLTKARRGWRTRLRIGSTGLLLHLPPPPITTIGYRKNGGKSDSNGRNLRIQAHVFYHTFWITVADDTGRVFDQINHLCVKNRARVKFATPCGSSILYVIEEQVA
jgi:hypothetical protein